MKLLQRWKQTALHNKALVWAGAIMAFGTVFYAGAAVFQVLLMKQSARDQAAQFDRIAQKVDSFISQLDRSNTLGQVASEESGKRIRESLDSSTKQSKSAIDASIAASRLDQRAWVGVIAPRLVKEPVSAREDVTFMFTLANTGKTPALEVSFVEEICIWAINSAGPGDPDWAHFSGSNEGTVLAGGTTGELVAKEPGNIFGQGMIDVYRLGTYKLRLKIHVKYKDVFNTPHWTEVCIDRSFGGPLNNALYCPNGGGIDTP